MDFVYIWEDMCYNHGSMISPKLFRELMLPRYKLLTDAVHKAGIEFVFVDTDGDCTELLDLIVEGGCDAVLPFEVGSGMDVSVVRAEYPKLGLAGGVNKIVPAGSVLQIEKELEKVEKVIKKGRYIPSSDHPVLPNVSYEQYISFYTRIGKMMGR